MVRRGRKQEQILVPCATLERVFRVSQQMISEYVKAGMPRADRGRYDLAACTEWYLDRKRAEIEQKLDDLDWKEQDTRLKRAKARIAEMEADQLQGSVVNKEIVRNEYARVANNIRSRLLGIGGSLSPQLVGISSVQAVQKMLDDSIWNALDELSRADFEKAGAAALVKAKAEKRAGASAKSTTRERRNHEAQKAHKQDAEP